jgi:hypothetical protein
MQTRTACQSEDDFLNDDVSDEALETAAVGEKAGAYTVSFCTSGAVCPA